MPRRTYPIRLIFLLFIFSVSGSAYAHTEPASADDPIVEAALLGTWYNLSLEVQLLDKDSTFLVPDGKWEEILQIKPIETTYFSNQSFISNYYSLKGELLFSSSGLWKIKGDSIYLIQEGKTTAYLLELEQDKGTFTGKIDWDQDGQSNDLYAGIQQKASASPNSINHKTQSIDNLLIQYYAMISGPIGEKRDLEQFKALFHPKAQLIYSHANSEDSEKQETMVMTPQGFIDKLGYLDKIGFYERELSRKVDSFGAVTQVFSTYEFYAQDESIKGRGITSYNLHFDGERYWITSMLWTMENDQHPIPKAYLPGN